MPDNLTLEIPVIASAYVWMTVLQNLQLALRHPSNSGPSAELVRQFGDHLLEKLIAEGVFSQEEAAQIWHDVVRDELIARNRKPPADFEKG